MSRCCHGGTTNRSTLWLMEKQPRRVRTFVIHFSYKQVDSRWKPGCDGTKNLPTLLVMGKQLGGEDCKQVTSR